MKKFTVKANAWLQRAKKTVVYGGAMASMALASAMPVSAKSPSTQIVENQTTANVVGGILDVIFNIALYIGIVITIIGIFSFILAFKDDNAESQSRGIRLAIVGACLMGLKLLVSMTGLIK